jgi:RNA polymerase sigma-70 factor (ECF subfamily)
VWWNAHGEDATVDMPRNTSVPDTRLVRRSQQGDRRAFRALLTRYDWHLRGLAHALLLEPGQVDAVLRVAYVKAWREVVRIDPREDAAAWLYRLVYNACIDGLRREGTRIGAAPSTAAQVPDAADAAGESPVQPGPAGHNGAPSASADGHRARVVEALAALGPADRVAVVLVDREGFAPEAAARILGLTPDTVATRLASARARLVHQFADVVAAAAPPPAEDSEPPADAEAQQEEQEAQPEAPEAQPDEQEAEAEPEQREAQLEESEAQHEEHDVELDDTPVDAVDTKVASRSAAGGSPNGSSGAASTNGSDDSGGDGP